MPTELVARGIMVLLEQLPPLLVAFFGGKSGRSNNVGKQQCEKYPLICLNWANPRHKLFDFLDEPILAVTPITWSVPGSKTNLALGMFEAR